MAEVKHVIELLIQAHEFQDEDDQTPTLSNFKESTNETKSFSLNHLKVNPH